MFSMCFGEDLGCTIEDKFGAAAGEHEIEENWNLETTREITERT